MSTKKLDVKFDLALIKEVQKYTMLYNVNAKGYMNCEKKSRIWNNIGERLKTTGRNCYKRWQSMKNSYKQNVLRAQKNGRAPTWIYYEKMKFLENYPRPKQMKIFELEHKKQKVACINYGTSTSGNFDEHGMCLRLIEEVKNHDILYNKMAPNYYDSAMRSAVWKEIANNLGSSENACKDKWRSFRDLYIRIQKRLLLYKNSNDAQCQGRQWRFFSHMQFLDKYIVFNIDRSVMNGDDSSTFNDQEGKEKSVSQNSEFDVQEHLRSTLYDTTKKIFEKEDNFKLIEMVKQHEILFHRKFAAKPTIARNGEWEDIAVALNTNVPSCKERWRCLRDQYIKYKRRVENLGAASGENFVTWPYYHALTFLDEHIQRRYRENTLIRNETVAINAEIEDNSVEYSPAKEEEYPTIYEELKSCDLAFDDNLSNMANTYDETASADLTSMHAEQWKNELEDNVLLNDCERSTNEISENEEDEQILYLQSDANDEISSDSYLSKTSSKAEKFKEKHSLLENLAELLNKSRQECTTCAERRMTPKDSTNLLFESLAVSIKTANLAESDLLELQSDMHSFVAQRLVKYKKTKLDAPIFEFTALN